MTEGRSFTNIDRVRMEYPVQVIMLTAFDLVQQSRDGAAPFLQEANFYWLTGIEEAGWRCIITPEMFYLVAPDKDEVHRIFDGGMTYDEAKRISGADEVLSVKQSVHLLEGLAAQYETILTLCEDPHADHYDFALNPAPGALLGQLEALFSCVEDCRSTFAKLRAIKTDEEVKRIRQAIAYTQDAFKYVRSGLKAGEFSYEYEVEAQFSHEIRRRGASGHAYEPIVAGGRNALTLHYSKNNQMLPKDGLVLIDIGARFDGYAADITRTYAIGQPSLREQEVHAAVEKAHFEIVTLIKPGASLREYHDQTDEIMKNALQGLGLLEDRSDNETYRKYFPHAVGHGLGVDVHESLGGYEVFQPGMLLTVEPGIYIPEEGIGIRIEDDILVTSDGNDNLSAGLSTQL